MVLTRQNLHFSVLLMVAPSSSFPSRDSLSLILNGTPRIPVETKVGEEDPSRYLGPDGLDQPGGDPHVLGPYLQNSEEHGDLIG